MTQLITLSATWQGMSASFIEGALLAANANPKPLQPETWLPVLLTGGVVEEPTAVLDSEDKDAILAHFEQQYQHIKAGEYQLIDSLDYRYTESVTSDLIAFAEGFLAVWPVVEDHWQEQPLGDGTMRMLSALLTSMMLLQDEEGTLAQMEAAGVGGMPAPAELYAQLPLMLNEVVMAADELQQGSAAQMVNPYKEVGRNDSCPCGSGKKFKQCCASS